MNKMELIEEQRCGCIYDVITESYYALCEYHSFNGLINVGRKDEFKTRIVKNKLAKQDRSKQK